MWLESAAEAWVGRRAASRTTGPDSASKRCEGSTFAEDAARSTAVTSAEGAARSVSIEPGRQMSGLVAWQAPP